MREKEKMIRFDSRVARMKAKKRGKEKRGFWMED
jgi:hypothetical protein